MVVAEGYAVFVFYLKVVDEGDYSGDGDAGAFGDHFGEWIEEFDVAAKAVDESGFYEGLFFREEQFHRTE